MGHPDWNRLLLKDCTLRVTHIVAVYGELLSVRWIQVGEVHWEQFSWEETPLKQRKDSLPRAAAETMCDE